MSINVTRNLNYEEQCAKYMERLTEDIGKGFILSTMPVLKGLGTKTATRTKGEEEMKDYYTEITEDLIKAQQSRNDGSEFTAAAPEAEAAPKAARVLKYPKGTKKFSDVFGIAPDKVEHPITVLRHSKETAPFVPKVDEGFVPTPTALELMAVGLEMGDNILITGPTGSGKSSLVQHVCSKTNRPLIRVNMSGDVESSALLGSYTVEDGATVFNAGPITEAVTKGYTLLVDEYDVTPPEILMVMQWLLEDDGKLYLKEMAGTSEEKVITPHKDFRIVATGNTVGQGDMTSSYAGTTVQNAASLDRFGTAIELGYLKHEHEKAMIKSRVPDIDDKSIDKMLTVADLVRKSYDDSGLGLTFSPRTLVSWAKKTVYWEDALVALRIAFFDKLTATDKQQVNTFLHKVYGRTI